MRPGYSLLACALFCLGLGAVSFFSLPASLFLLVAAFAIVFVAIVDALFLLLLTERVAVSREVASSFAIGELSIVRLVFSRDGRGFLPRKLRVFDLYPDSMECSAFPAAVQARDWGGGSSYVLEYPVLPVKRGPWAFPAVELLSSSPLHFWRQKRRISVSNEGRTYPDFKKLLALSSGELRGVTDRVGLKNIRRRGQGLEFESLREYQEGDSIRSIDWRASSRRQGYVVRDYTEDKDQQIVFLLDAGYRLNRRDGDYLQFDHALNAVLLLSYVALKHEDRVAVASFGADERWVRPRKGVSSLNLMMNELYDLESDSVPSSPFAALEKALERIKKRSLIVLVSNFREEDGEALSWILPRVQRHHLLLLVSLKETEATEIASGPAGDADAALEKAAAFSYLQSRTELYKDWERLGLLTLEATASNLSPALINRYLDLKRSGRL